MDGSGCACPMSSQNPRRWILILLSIPLVLLLEFEAQPGAFAAPSGNVNRLFQSISAILTPVVLSRTGFLVGPAIQQVVNPGQNSGRGQQVVIDR